MQTRLLITVATLTATGLLGTAGAQQPTVGALPTPNSVNAPSPASIGRASNIAIKTEIDLAVKINGVKFQCPKGSGYNTDASYALIDLEVRNVGAKPLAGANFGYQTEWSVDGVTFGSQHPAPLSQLSIDHLSNPTPGGVPAYIPMQQVKSSGRPDNTKLKQPKTVEVKASVKVLGDITEQNLSNNSVTTTATVPAMLCK